MFPPIDQLTAQGYDLTFGTNVLGHFYLTKLLIPALLAGARSSPDKKTRVVNTASSMSLFSRGINFNTLSDGRARKKKSPTMLYCQSKLVSLFTTFIIFLKKKYWPQNLVDVLLYRGTYCLQMNWRGNLERKASLPRL